MNKIIIIKFQKNEDRTICFKLPDKRKMFMDLEKLKRGVVELRYSAFPTGSSRLSHPQYFKFMADTDVEEDNIT